MIVTVLDFTSSLYLGMEHRASVLPSWPQLTLGKPAALEEPPGARGVEHDLATLTGCEAAVLASSTLHLFVDLIPMLAGPRAAIFVDRDAYRMAWWGIQQASAAGVKPVRFGPNDPQELRELLNKARAIRPIVITDGISVASGQPAPIGEYARECARHGGVLVVDDTQALGIHGAHPVPMAPYGTGGGGSLRRAGLNWPGAILVNSLAKGFGAGVAMLGGSMKMIARFRRHSLTRMHCSPPSAAVIAAAGRALAINDSRGDALRQRLAKRVARFENGLERTGLRSNRSLFPVRPLKLPKGIDPRVLHEALEKRGVRSILQVQSRAGGRVNFVIRVSHRLTEIDAAIEALSEAVDDLTVDSF
jgi:8-amino-7-oxononanoate synthase